VIHGVVIVIFSYFGAEIVTIAAAESSEPEKAVQKATATTVWRVILFYVGSVALIVVIIPWLPTDTSPFAAAFGKFGIPAAETIVSAMVLTAALSVLNSGLYTALRMLFALRRHGWAPRWVADALPPAGLVICCNSGSSVSGPMPMPMVGIGRFGSWSLPRA
jgi:GABA permease